MKTLRIFLINFDVKVFSVQDVPSNKSALTYVPDAGTSIGDSLVPLSSEFHL